MKSKPSILLCLFAVLCLAALTGCGDANDEPTQPANNANTNAAATPAAGQQNTNAVGAGQTTNKGATPAAGGTRITGTLKADPNPMQLCGGASAGKTTISWDVKGGGRFQVRVGTPDGALMVDSTQPQGKSETGNWVTDGAKFLLLDASGPRPETIATVTVKGTKEGCR